VLPPDNDSLELDLRSCREEVYIMEHEDLNVAVERINAGAQIPAVEPSQIEHMWLALSRTPADRRKNTAVGLTAVCANREFAPKSPDEQVAMMTRYALLDALLERGILNDYMKNESARKEVFAAVARIPCDKSDLGEALAERVLREASTEAMEQKRAEAKSEGWDIDRPKIGEKLIGWIRSHG
jgi:hypothetical protein